MNDFDWRNLKLDDLLEKDPVIKRPMHEDMHEYIIKEEMPRYKKELYREWPEPNFDLIQYNKNLVYFNPDLITWFKNWHVRYKANQPCATGFMATAAEPE